MVHQPDPVAPRGHGCHRRHSIRPLYGPCVELRRTIASPLGENSIDVIDEFRNMGNQRVPHAWLLHINFGYPLWMKDPSSATTRPESSRWIPLLPQSASNPDPTRSWFPSPQDAHRGPDSAVAYLFPKALDQTGRTRVAVVNRRLGVGVAIDYNTRQFSRCGSWQHFGPGEYVTALEPMNGTIEGRWRDREQGRLDFLEPAESRRYRYRLSVVSDRDGIEALRALNSAT